MARCKKCRTTPNGVLDGAGLCANCTGPTSSCDQGERCAYPRIFRFNHHEINPAKLDLCAYHDKLLKKKLADSKAREKATLKRQREA